MVIVRIQSALRKQPKTFQMGRLQSIQIKAGQLAGGALLHFSIFKILEVINSIGEVETLDLEILGMTIKEKETLAKEIWVIQILEIGMLEGEIVEITILEVKTEEIGMLAGLMLDLTIWGMEMMVQETQDRQIRVNLMSGYQMKEMTTLV